MDLETRYFIDDAAGRIRLTRVIPDHVKRIKGKTVVPEPARSPLRLALRDPGGPVSAAVIAVLAGTGIQLARENFAGTALSAVLVGLLAYLGYLVVAWVRCLREA